MKPTSLETLLKEFEKAPFYQLLGCDERDLGGEGTKSEVKDWVRTNITALLGETYKQMESFKLDKVPRDAKEYKYYYTEGYNEGMGDAQSIIKSFITKGEE